MATVFISYARADQALARAISQRLKASGFDVWWDDELLPHHAFARSIEEQVRAARAVVVVWSEHAVASQWVRAEADLARAQGTLVQVVADGCAIPLPFNQFQAADLRGWNGDPNDPNWLKVLASVTFLAAPAAAGVAVQPPPSSAGALTPVRPNALRRFAGKRRNVVLAACAGVIVVAALLAYIVAGRNASNAQIRGARIAVQPFEALDSASAVHEFASNISDSLQGVLADDQIETVSRADAQNLNGPDAPSKIRALGVGLLFSGTVHADAGTLTVRMHLDDPLQHVVIWTAEMQGPAAKTEPLQARVGARTVSVLNCSARALRPSGGIADPAVLGLYLHACDQSEANGPDEVQSEVGLLDTLRQVVARAPAFAPGHSMLAKYAAFLAPSFPPDESASIKDEAQREARRALELDPKEPDAFVAQALLAPPLDFFERERILRQALAFDPVWPHANGFLGNVMLDIGRIEDAIPLYERAAAVNPQSLDWTWLGPRALFWSGRADEADAQLAHLAVLWPNSADVWRNQLNSLETQHRWSDCLATLARGAAYPGATSPASLARTRSTYRALLSGKRADLEAARRRFLAPARDDPSSIANAIERLSMLGYADDAFTVAKRDIPVGAEGFSSAFLFGPRTAALRRDARFITVAAKFGLIDYWRKTGRWPDFCTQPGLKYDCRSEANRIAPAPAHS